MANGRSPQADAVKAHPYVKTHLARLLKSGVIKPVLRAAHWYNEISGDKIPKEKFRKFFDTQLKKHYDEDLVRSSRAKSPKDL